MCKENIYSLVDCDSFKNLIEVGIDYYETNSSDEFFQKIFENKAAIQSRKDHIIKIVQLLMNEYSCLDELENSAVEHIFTDLDY